MITSSKFKIYTIVDVTNTKERNPGNSQDYKRNQNFQTMLNTIGLRSNPIIINYPVLIEKPKAIKFGTSYDVEQCFFLELEGEYANSFSIENFIHDFNLVPVFGDLSDQTITPSVFDTKSKLKKNIVFVFDK